MRMVTVLDPECVPSDFLGEYANWKSGIEEEQDRQDQGCTNVSPGLGKFRIPGHSVSPGLLATATVTTHSLWTSLGYNCSWCQRHFLTGPDAVEVNLAGVRAWPAWPSSVPYASWVGHGAALHRPAAQPEQPEDTALEEGALQPQRVRL